jgi:hypothetical protein
MADIEDVFREAREDPTLLSTIDIEAVLKKTDDVHYIEGKTVADISKEIFEAVSALDISEENKQGICQRLIGYRWVDRLCDLRSGRLVRWIKGGKLTNGGLLMNVKIENTGVILLCKNNVGRFFSIKWDESIVFQKLSMEEQLVLMANE